MTKMRMDEMLMDQVMTVSSGTSRVCANEEKYEPATIRGLPADLVKKGQAREMRDLDDMNVLEWMEESMVPKDALVVLKDYAVTKLDDLYAPTPTSMTVRRLLFYAAWFELEVSTSGVRVAFMHAVCFGTQVCETSSGATCRRMTLTDQEINERNDNNVERPRRLGCRRDERNSIRARNSRPTDLQRHQIPSGNCILR